MKNHRLQTPVEISFIQLERAALCFSKNLPTILCKKRQKRVRKKDYCHRGRSSTISEEEKIWYFMRGRNNVLQACKQRCNYRKITMVHRHCPALVDMFSRAILVSPRPSIVKVVSPSAVVAFLNIIAVGLLGEGT